MNSEELPLFLWFCCKWIISDFVYLGVTVFHLQLKNYFAGYKVFGWQFSPSFGTSNNVISVSGYPQSLFFHFMATPCSMWNLSSLCVGAKSLQLCLTLCDPMGYSPPGSSVCGILQAPTLEWDAMPSSRESSQPSDQTQVSCFAGRFFTIWATIYGQLIFVILQALMTFNK